MKQIELNENQRQRVLSGVNIGTGAIKGIVLVFLSFFFLPIFFSIIFNIISMISNIQDGSFYIMSIIPNLFPIIIIFFIVLNISKKSKTIKKADIFQFKAYETKCTEKRELKSNNGTNSTYIITYEDNNRTMSERVTKLIYDQISIGDDIVVTQGQNGLRKVFSYEFLDTPVRTNTTSKSYNVGNTKVEYKKTTTVVDLTENQHTPDHEVYHDISDYSKNKDYEGEDHSSHEYYDESRSFSSSSTSPEKKGKSYGTSPEFGTKKSRWFK